MKLKRIIGGIILSLCVMVLAAELTPEEFTFWYSFFMYGIILIWFWLILLGIYLITSD